MAGVGAEAPLPKAVAQHDHAHRASGPSSSSGRKVRPSAGTTPSTSKKLPETSWVQMRSLSRPTLRLAGCSFVATTAASDREPRRSR